MELVTKKMHTAYTGKLVNDQFFIDEDYNVPDAKGDIARIIYSEGNLRVDDVKHMENYLKVNGKLVFRILYVTDEGEKRLASLEGKIPFDEMIYIEDHPDGRFQILSAKVDFTASLVHSRKVSIKAVAELTAAPEGLKDEEVAVDLEENMPVYKKSRPVNLLQLMASKKDTYRIKEELTIPASKENVGTMIWSDVISRKMDSRLVENALVIKGELLVFLFYESPDGKTDWLEQSIPYEGQIECSGVDDQMYHHVSSTLGDIILDLRPDEDGELRIIGIEGTMELKLVAYREETLEVLEDVYALGKECDLKQEKRQYDGLVMQNHSQCRVTEQLNLPELGGDLLQICHSAGVLEPESYQIIPEGIRVEGILHVSFLYVKASDEVPYDTWQGMVPFSYVIESNETVPDMKYDIAPHIEQLSVNMVGNGQVEVKAVLAFDSLFRKPVVIHTISDAVFRDIDKKEMEKRPGLIGYTVKPGDDLWKLAKRYCTTMEGIQEVNHLNGEELKEGEKILIFKESMGIL